MKYVIPVSRPPQHATDGLPAILDILVFAIVHEVGRRLGYRCVGVVGRDKISRMDLVVDRADGVDDLLGLVDALG